MFKYRLATSGLLLKWTKSVLPRLSSSHSVVESTGSFNGLRGDHIAYRIWKTEENESKRGLLMICHGFGAHSGRWEDRAVKWAQRQLVVTCHDHYGHGLSSGERVNALDYQWLIDDMRLHAQSMKQLHPDVPVLAIGQSMGAVILMGLAIQSPDLFDGIILSATPLVADPKIHTPVRVYGSWLLHKLVPNLGFMDFKAPGTSNQKAEWQKDELCYRGKMKIGFTYASHVAITNNIANMHKLRTPFMIVHGERDHLYPLQGAYDLMERAQTNDKHIKIYNSSHSVFMDPECAETALSDCNEWMDQRLPKLDSTE